MRHLEGKRIIVAISGSIAAYKMATTIRLLIKAGAEVRVLMTPAATHFITPLTLSTLSKNPVFSEVISEESWNNHVEMGLWADAMLLAPATANTLAQLANGLCDTIVAAVYLSARCPVFFAPAMDLDMWAHPATQTNVKRLIDHGNHLIPVGNGELASGLSGEGRMAEPEDLVGHLHHFFGESQGQPGVQQSMAGKKVLITAGPTHEPIDPVRYIGNRSSGKMGVALALEAARRGAHVRLILGPSVLNPTAAHLHVTRVDTAREMFKAASGAFEQCDLAIFAAAVADYRPEQTADQKIKKTKDALRLDLVKNPDIAATLGKQKQAHQRLIGFALETQAGEEHARRKLSRKNLDAIVLNTLQDEGAGFQHDTNKVSILTAADNKLRRFELKTKEQVATDILDVAEQWWPVKG